jgi:cytochrome c oxidase cbb3-type subunit 3
MTLLGAAACGKSDRPRPGQATPNEVAQNDSAPKKIGGSVRYPEYGAAAGLLPPADSLVNPVRADSIASRQGRQLFSTMNCDGCHGEGALGFVGPSLVDGRWRYGGEDGAVFQSIFYGRPKGMPAYGGLLSEGTIWQLVTYLQTQPVPSVVPTASWQ